MPLFTEKQATKIVIARNAEMARAGKKHRFQALPDPTGLGYLVLRVGSLAYQRYV